MVSRGANIGLCGISDNKHANSNTEVNFGLWRCLPVNAEVVTR